MARNLAEKNERRFTYADYKAWELKPGERFELIYGETYAMSAPGTMHQQVSMFLSGVFFNFLTGKPCRAFAAPFDVRLFFKGDESDDTVVQPDLVVVCDHAKLGPEGCRGAPELVVEILSPSNTAIEMERKLNLYREAGVQEYWVVNPESKQICVYHLQSNQFALWARCMEDTVQSAVLPGLEVKLSAIFAELL